ncbi:DNA mismatch repair protein MutT [Rhizobium rhizosphaerae]|uniref:DNA mismatch repair protein MutT n=1 Tax=Xaviernesmea rhizosphaerae TaxID=1672749 RepID=A0ABX3P979_9HYPH|nr:DNA mismatch repair protein MutT [Xaviernesmea rhizosphaerae]OQP84152.1 DNA mismatch repair protein MutT [Xaviernesmea rhizosphaerae]
MIPARSNFTQWPPEKTLFPLEDVTVNILAGPHPYAVEAKEAIVANWAVEFARNPRLFDGQMVVNRAIHIEEGRIRTAAHLAPFSAFLLWRKTRPLDKAVHLFVLPVILSSDGALIAVRMGAHTANPGKVYCASGSLDAHDIVDGRCDIPGNMRREVLEETGLDLAEAEADPHYVGRHENGAVMVARIFRFSDDAETLVARIAAHVAADPEPEIDGAVAIIDTDPARYDYASFMPDVIAWALQR